MSAFLKKIGDKCVALPSRVKIISGCVAAALLVLIGWLIFGRGGGRGGADGTNTRDAAPAPAPPGVLGAYAPPKNVYSYDDEVETPDEGVAAVGDVPDGDWRGKLIIAALVALLIFCCYCCSGEPSNARAYDKLKEQEATKKVTKTREEILAELDKYQKEIEEMKRAQQAHTAAVVRFRNSFNTGASALMLLVRLRSKANRKKEGTLRVRLERAVGLKGGDVRLDVNSRYMPRASRNTARLSQAVGLKKGVSATLTGDPYVVLKCGKDTKQSRVVPQRLDPVWNEDIEFFGTLDDLIKSGLSLKVYDKDMMHKDDHLAETDVSLSSFAVMPGRTVKKEESLNPQGTLFFSLTWTPATVKADLERVIAPAAYGPAQWLSPTAHGVLKIQLERGTKLPSADSNGLSDPYVILACGGEKKTSKTIWKTLDPEWNEGFEFKSGVLADFLKSGLVLKVMDKDKYSFSGDDHLGDVNVSLEEIRESGSHNYHEELKGTPIACGSVRFQVRHWLLPPSRLAAPSPTCSHLLAPSCGSVRFQVTWLAKGAVSYKPKESVDAAWQAQAQAHQQAATQQAAGPDTGVLHVKVQSAERLRATGGTAKANPYVIIHYGVQLKDVSGAVRPEKREKQTRVEMGAANPIWNQTLDLYGSLSDIKKDGLLLRILNKEVVSHKENVESNHVLGEERTWLSELTSVQDERKAALDKAKQALLVAKRVPGLVVERAYDALASVGFPSMTQVPDEAADEACASESPEYRTAWLAMRKAEWTACRAYLDVKGKRRQRHEYALNLLSAPKPPPSKGVRMSTLDSVREEGEAGGGAHGAASASGPKLFFTVEWVPEGCTEP